MSSVIDLSQVLCCLADMHVCVGGGRKRVLIPDGGCSCAGADAGVNEAEC